MTTFLLQIENDGHLSELSAPVREAILAERAWALSKDDVQFQYEETSIESVGLAILRPGLRVPVGSVEFCNKALSALNKNPLKAINVPGCLRKEQYIGRAVFDISSEDEMNEFLQESPLTTWLVKPGDVPKRFHAFTAKGILPKWSKNTTPPFFVSQMLVSPIVAEWRVFFYRHEIVGARPYILDEWVCPDQGVVKEMLGVWTGAPDAGTLDVAVLEDGRTVLLEVHQFIACGLYGFENRILPMLRDAWRWELAQKPVG